jgi:hypothetical protein
MVPQKAQSPVSAASRVAPSRIGKRGVTFYLLVDEWKQLQWLSVDSGATIQKLMEEAVGLLFANKAAKARKASTGAQPRKAAP